MRRIIHAIRNHLPRRRRRLWRYVSPRRRGAGMVVLALLVTCLYAYWHFTNDARIRREAESCLRELTGARVTIASASFSFFRGIELRDVRIYVPDGLWRRPFFEAPEVVLRHCPWRLLLSGRVHATRIVCIKPVVTNVYDRRGQTSSSHKILKLASRAGGPGAGAEIDLPPMRFVGGLLRIFDRFDDLPPYLVGEIPLNATGHPGQSGRYVFLLELPREGPRARFVKLPVNLRTGEWTVVGELPEFMRLASVLPPEQRQWLARRRIRGDLKVRGGTGADAPRGALILELKDVSLRLPVEEGGLELLNVGGTLVLDSRGVDVRNVSGRIPQAGGARFRLSGRYGGYDSQSPYHVEFRIENDDEQDNLLLPKPSAVSGQLAKALEHLHECYAPAGRMKVVVTFERRERGGEVSFRGVAYPRGMKARCKWFPYAFRDVRGAIGFDNTGVAIQNLTARHGPTRVTMNGRLTGSRGEVCDITVAAEDMLFDEDLRRALPRGFVRIWDTLDPQGSAAAQVRILRQRIEDTHRVEVTIVADGKAAMTYAGFPYRLENLMGRVHVAPEMVRIDSIRGSRGPMRCTIRGTLAGLGTEAPEVDLTIEARHLPFDEKLLAALDARSRAVLASLKPTGFADDIITTVTQADGEDLSCNIRVRRLDGVGFVFESFPYAVTDARGSLTILPDRVVIEKIVGRHKDTPITVSGQAVFGKEGVGLDLSVRAENAAIDKELFEALPAEFKEVWRVLSPTGRADVTVAVQHNWPPNDGKHDYKLTLDARGMEMTYRDLPYRLRGIRGRVVATPKKIVLEKLSAANGEMKATMDGEILLAKGRHEAILSIHAENVPIDADFLRAMPEALAPLISRFRPGGECDLDFQRLRLIRTSAGGPATRPAAPPGRAGTPKPRFAWSTEPGRDRKKPPAGIHLRNAVLDLGFGDKRVSGKITGSATHDARGLAFDAGAALDEIVVGKRTITDLTARLGKRAGQSIISLKEIAAKAHGGRIAGLAEIRLSRPLEYGLQLSVEGISLEELFNAGVTDPKKRVNVKGLLAGNIQFIATAGKKPTRQASGSLRISKAKLYKLPVLMGLLHVIYLSLPGDSAFTDGYVTYRLRDRTLVFEEIHLTGSALSLVGSGTMDMKTERLKLNFLTGPPGKLPRLGSLNELLEGIVREIVEIRVTGTLSRPNMRTVPLRTIEEIIRTLSDPSRQAN